MKQMKPEIRSQHANQVKELKGYLDTLKVYVAEKTKPKATSKSVNKDAQSKKDVGRRKEEGRPSSRPICVSRHGWPNVFALRYFIRGGGRQDRGGVPVSWKGSLSRLRSRKSLLNRCNKTNQAREE